MKSRKDCSTHLPTLVTADFLTDCSQSNWKVFTDIYGNGCCHCGYACVDLASDIDESQYKTEIQSADWTIQHAAPSNSKNALVLTQQFMSNEIIILCSINTAPTLWSRSTSPTVLFVNHDSSKKHLKCIPKHTYTRVYWIARESMRRIFSCAKMCN